jgi:NAD(P) transhydrogenase subunit alpha
MESGDNAATPQRIGVPKEIFPGEKRVATVPDAVTKLVKLGFAVVIEQGAGDLADLSDAAYVEAGATISATEPTASPDYTIYYTVDEVPYTQTVTTRWIGDTVTRTNFGRWDEIVATWKTITFGFNI